MVATRVTHLSLGDRSLGVAFNTVKYHTQMQGGFGIDHTRIAATRMEGIDV
jgi:hypothetical protein